MSRFGNLTTEGLEETQDRVGGFSPLETDAYTGTIKVAYAGQSQGGAHNVTLIVDIDGREYRETVYVTNKKGENFFLNQNDKTKKVPLPGFTVIDDICLVTTDKPLAEQRDEEKIVNIYDFEAKREVPTSVPVLVDLLGKTVTLGIVKQLENKSEKQGDQYVPIADTREINFIDKVFHHPTGITTVEARNGIQEPKFLEAWTTRNKGNTRDKRTIKDGEAGTAGRPGRPGGAPQAAPAAGAQPARKSLFGGS
jgi:hypothetical protein